MRYIIYKVYIALFLYTDIFLAMAPNNGIRDWEVMEE